MREHTTPVEHDLESSAMHLPGRRSSFAMGAMATASSDTSERPRRRPGRPAASEPVGEIETRDLILLQARRLFMQRGYADVSVGEVAEAVGVTKPTLYYHFGDKEGLYTAVLCDLMREVGGYVSSVTRVTNRSVRQRMLDLALGYFTYADATMEPVLRDTNELLGPERAAEVRRAYEEDLLAPIEDLLREGMHNGEIRETNPRVLVKAFMGLLDAFTDPNGHRARDEEGHRQTAHTLVSLFLDGAAPRP